MSEYENAKEISESIDALAGRLDDIRDTLDECAMLRDRFAMAALTGMFSNERILNSFAENPTRMAAAAYVFADAMIEARKK
jgi:hypothetical protein